MVYALSATWRAGWQLRPGSLVLDIGAGLGGAARILAAEYDCHVDAVDISPSRCQANENLTRLLGLEHRVRVLCGDILDLNLRDHSYDLALGLDSFAHFEDKWQLLALCHRALKASGLLAVHDSYLPRRPTLASEERRLHQLQHHWLACFVAPELWLAAEQQSGFSRLHQDDLTPDFVQHFQRLDRVSVSPPQRELAGLATRGRTRRIWPDSIRTNCVEAPASCLARTAAQDAPPLFSGLAQGGLLYRAGRFEDAIRGWTGALRRQSQHGRLGSKAPDLPWTSQVAGRRGFGQLRLPCRLPGRTASRRCKRHG